MELSTQARDELLLTILSEIKTTIRDCALDEKNLWTAERIGQYFGGMSKRTIMQNYACLPDFPTPLDMPNQKTLWYASEVKEWATKHKKAKAKK